MNKTDRQLAIMLELQRSKVVRAEDWAFYLRRAYGQLIEIFKP